MSKQPKKLTLQELYEQIDLKTTSEQIELKTFLDNLLAAKRKANEEEAKLLNGTK